MERVWGALEITFDVMLEFARAERIIWHEVETRGAISRPVTKF